MSGTQTLMELAGEPCLPATSGSFPSCSHLPGHRGETLPHERVVESHGVPERGSWTPGRLAQTVPSERRQRSDASPHRGDHN